ncbi:hypothetical protein D3C73_1430580 [compost metagenome]
MTSTLSYFVWPLRNFAAAESGSSEPFTAPMVVAFSLLSHSVASPSLAVNRYVLPFTVYWLIPSGMYTP